MRLDFRFTQDSWIEIFDGTGRAILYDLGAAGTTRTISAFPPLSVTIGNAPAVALSVNGQVRQQSDVDKLIWNIRELLADLSQFYHLQPGDLIYTGTPEGVGAVLPGDRIEGHVDGVGSIALTVGPAE